MKIFTSQKQKIGFRGEKEAEMFLMKHDFKIIERNFSTRFGELDIIAEKDRRLHFIEIKAVTVSHETRLNRVINVSYETRNHVSRETFINENRKLNNPFQNISKSKIRRSLKTIELYLAMKHVPRETRWQLDGIGIFLDQCPGETRTEYIPNINVS